MSEETKGYWARLWTALLGHEIPPPVGPAVVPPGQHDLELEARVSGLEMDLRERDGRIAQMQREYSELEAAKERAAATSGQEGLERLFQKLAGTLANLAVLSAAVDDGQQVEAGDLVSLIRSLEREFARAGLEPIGQVNQQTEFDVAAHQRMSGGAVHPGTRVSVQLPGYRFGSRVLLKAMVSATQDQT